MIRRSLSLAAVVSLGAMMACGDGSNAPAPVADAADGGAETQAFGQVLTVDQIAVYQAVKVSLVTEAQAVAPNAPVIPKRPALVRIHTKLPPRVKVAKLTAELRIRAPGQPDLVLVNGPRSITSWAEDDLSSSFYWELEAEQVQPGAQLLVEIRDPSGADPSVIRYPAEGELPMNVEAWEPTLKVKFVPIRYDADGSGRIPSMDKRTIDSYRDALYKMYPVTHVDISVREVVPWPLEVRGDGEGWNQLLDAVIETREDDRAADDVYYVGVFTPNETQREYCQGGGCILGIAPAGSLGENVALRTAMIVGYHSARSHGTLAQELAHAMGRMHAPCGGPTGIDRKYPYADASIGTWGWDVLEKELIDPDERVDFMSYCNPVWVSDYTYAGIHARMVEVEREKRPVPDAPSGPAGGDETPSSQRQASQRQAMKTYHVAKDGTLTAGPTIHGAPSAADELVLEDASHRAVGTVRGSFRPISNIGGGILVTPSAIPAETLKRARFARPVAP